MKQLRLTVTATGTTNQLRVYLRQTLNYIDRAEEMGNELPWTIKTLCNESDFGLIISDNDYETN